MNLLLVDEDTSFAEVYAANLVDLANHKVAIAKDANQALDLIGRNKYDAIITEVLLPGRNGLKLIQDIRIQPSWLNIPIYILTTLQAADINLAHSLSAALGVKAYLVKQQTTPQALAEILGLANKLS